MDFAVLEPGAVTEAPRRTGPDQFFYMISGRGRVAGSDDAEFPVGRGSLVEWKSGEEHTSWADERMLILIIQRRS